MSILLAILAMIFFGFTVFFYKQGTPFFSTGLGASIFILSHMLILGILTLMEKSKYDWKQSKFLILGGICGGIAQICFFLALKNGKLNTVVPIRNMALLVTVILGVLFLAEKLTLLKTIGIVLGVIAVVLVSI